MFTRDAELARRAFEAWEKGTLRQFAERHVHPDLEFHDAPEMPDAQVVRGRDEALARMDSYMEQLGRFSIPVCEVIQRSNGVVVRVAPSGRAPASGVAVEWEVYCVMRFRHGLMVEIRNYFDRDSALAVADVDPSVGAR
jgi:ketosteroid isomerase-like protein